MILLLLQQLLLRLLLLLPLLLIILMLLIEALYLDATRLTRESSMRSTNKKDKTQFTHERANYEYRRRWRRLNSHLLFVAQPAHFRRELILYKYWMLLRSLSLGPFSKLNNYLRNDYNTSIRSQLTGHVTCYLVFQQLNDLLKVIHFTNNKAFQLIVNEQKENTSLKIVTNVVKLIFHGVNIQTI